jgi:N-acetylmuramoyl-L-alanine amidase
VLTRSTDTFVDLDTRPELAKRMKADLFVSLHYNSASLSPNGVKGIEVYCLTPPGMNSTHESGDDREHKALPGNRFDEQNILLAYHLLKSIHQSLGVEDRGVKRARFVVLRTAQMPAVLIEGGFMSDPAEAKQIYDTAHRRQLAQAIVDGVLAYKRLVEPPPSRPKKALKRVKPPASAEED